MEARFACTLRQCELAVTTILLPNILACPNAFGRFFRGAGRPVRRDASGLDAMMRAIGLPKGTIASTDGWNRYVIAGKLDSQLRRGAQRSESDGSVSALR